MSSSAATPGEPWRRPGLLLGVCVVVVLEAALLIGVAGAYLVSIVRGTSEAPGTAAGIAGFGALLGAVLLLLPPVIAATAGSGSSKDL